MSGIFRNRYVQAFLASAIIAGALIIIWPRPYMKYDSPPDVDKNLTNPAEVEACWLASAANILAAAGYGTQNSLSEFAAGRQARAEQIYKEMLELLCGSKPGWVETAILKWLDSNYNVGPYSVYASTKAYGLETPIDGITNDKDPWDCLIGPKKIANHLRRCDHAAIYISWPFRTKLSSGEEIITGAGGHWLTCWGDELSYHYQTSNPSTINVTDSDLDLDGDVQSYTYDSYENPNPVGPNMGNGWYIDYKCEGDMPYCKNHPYIRQAVVLIKPIVSTLIPYAPISSSSYRLIRNKNLNVVAAHYEVAVDTAILNLVTSIAGSFFHKHEALDLKEEQRNYSMEWDFKKDPLSPDQPLTITTELILPDRTGMRYQNVALVTSNDAADISLPDIEWTVAPENIPKESIEHFALGGYVIGSFDIFDKPGDSSKMEPIAQFRLIHQYKYSQSPSLHKFLMAGTKGFYVGNIRFGHSYGFLDGNALWEFNAWKTHASEEMRILEDAPIAIDLDFGPMPYPEPWESPTTAPIK